MKRFKKVSMTILCICMVACLAPVFFYSAEIKTIVYGAETKDSIKERTLIKGEKVNLKVTQTDEKISYQSSNRLVASVTKDGLVTGIKAGKATITVKIGKKAYPYIIKVESPYLSKEKVSLLPSETQKVKLKGTSQTVTYVSSNATVATVSKWGTITAVSEGNAIIYAKVSNHQYACKVAVTSEGNEAYTTKVGEEYQITIGNEEVTWLSSNSNIATIDQDGVVTALKPGVAILTGKTKNGSIKIIQTVENSISYAVANDTYEGLDPIDRKLAKVLLSIQTKIITKEMSKVDKVKAVHDYLVLNTAYDFENYKNNTIPTSSYSPEGVLLRGVAVCQGYAETFQLFMDLLNIESKVVTGLGNGVGHAWNIVKLDDGWYHIDVTWDDPVPNTEGFVRYNYFLVNDDMIKLDHTFDTKQYEVADASKYLLYPYKAFIATSEEGVRDVFLKQFMEGKQDIIMVYPKDLTISKEFIFQYTSQYSYYEPYILNGYKIERIIIK